MKQKVIKNAQGGKRQKSVKIDFAKIYDKLKAPTFKSKPNMEGFRAISKDVLQSNLSATAKGIYPVLCWLSDYEKAKQIQVSKSKNTNKIK